MLQEAILERIEFINRIALVFKQELEETLPRKFRRGPIQGWIFKRFNIPRTGPNMRAVNEAMEMLGYKQIKQDGWGCYKKIKAD